MLKKVENFKLTDIEVEKINLTIKRFDKPFFFYNLNTLKKRLEGFSSLMDNDFRLWYACKANPLSAILKIFRNLNFGIDIASIGELTQVLNTGITNDHLIATGPAKSKDYMTKLLKEGVSWIVLESVNQAVWLNEAAKELDVTAKALVRVQLKWEGSEKSVLGGTQITPFGEEIATWKSVDFKSLDNIKLSGVHIFQWGNILNIEELSSIWTTIAKTCGELANFLKIKDPILDLGGGLGIAYSEKETDLDFNQVYRELVKLKKNHNFKKIWMELGRYCVGPIGKYICKVEDIKTVHGESFLVLNGGINHLSRHALTGQSFPCSVLNKSLYKKSKLVTFNLCGPLCTALDLFGSYELPEDIKIGEYIIFHQTGAYGFTESMPYFLCHDMPAEIILYGDDLVTPRLSKPATDWLA